MGNVTSKTVENPTALTKMALAAIIGSKARRLAEYAENGDFKNFRENFGKYPLLGTRDYTIFVIYVSMFVCAVITKDTSEEAKRAKELAEELLEDMHTARSFFNFGIGWGPAIYDNLKKMSKFKEFLKIMSNGKYTNGYDSAFGKRIKHVIPWITKTSKTALQTLAVPAMKALFGTTAAATKFKQGVQKMGEEYVSTDAAYAIETILYYRQKLRLFSWAVIEELSDIRIKEDYPKLPRYSKLLMDGDDIEASYLSGTYFPLMKDLTELFAKGLKSYHGDVFNECTCNDPNTLAYGLERLLALGDTTVSIFDSPDASGLKDKDYRRLVNFIINHLCKSKVLAKIDEESKENFAEELREKYINTYELMFPISAKIHAATEKLKSKFSRNKITQVDDNDSNDRTDTPPIPDLGEEDNDDEEGSGSTTTEISSEAAAADPDKANLASLCDAVKNVTLDDLGYEGSALKAEIVQSGATLVPDLGTFGERFADSEGTTFEDKVKDTFTTWTAGQYSTWENILYIVWIRYAALSRRDKARLLQFATSELDKLSYLTEPYRQASDSSIIDPISAKLKKAESSADAGDDQGSSTTGGTITKTTPLTVGDFRAVGDKLGKFNQDSLRGYKQSAYCADYLEDYKKTHKDEYNDTKRENTLSTLFQSSIGPLWTHGFVRNSILKDSNDSDPITDKFIQQLFNLDSSGDDVIWDNKLRLLMLYEAGAQAGIKDFYDRFNEHIVAALTEFYEVIKEAEDKYLESDHHSLKKAPVAANAAGNNNADTDDDDSNSGGAVTKDTPFNVDELKLVAAEVATFTIDKDLPGLEQSEFFSDWMTENYEGDRGKTKKRATEVLQYLKEDLDSTALNSATDVGEFIKDLFVEGSSGSYYMYSNELRVMILAIAGHPASIEHFYDRLIHTLSELTLNKWGKTQLDEIARDYFDTNTFTLKKKQA